MKLLITAKFHVFVSQGEGKRETRFDYAPGMVVDTEDLPEGHTADGEGGWIAKGLARDPSVPVPELAPVLALEAPAAESDEP